MTFGSTKLAARLAAIIRTIPIVHRSNESSDLRLSLHSTIMSRLYGILIVLVLTSSVKTELVRTRPYAFDAKAYESNTEESNAEAYDAKAYESRKSELMFVSVVFRHGDRAPDDNGKELYPNDPYLKYSFFPMGLGGLTNNGKMREYSLGEELRERYSNFLGTTYLPTDIVARSTDYSRTKMSLALVLASLYPPDRLQRWNSKLRWQPIPSTYVPNSLDVLLIPEECPQYLEELERVKSLPEVKKQVDKFRPLMEKLTKLTGKPIKDTNDMYYLYHDLMAESSMGLKLPRWTKPLFPYGPLWNGTILEYDIVSYNEMLKRLNGGTLLRRITDDMVAAIKNGTRNARKMNIFSGHETNIAALLQTLGVYKPHVPEYSSAIFVELIRQNDVYYVQVLYYLGIPPDVVALTIPGCEQLCPLDAFLQLLENVIPTDEDLVCPNSTQPPTGF